MNDETPKKLTPKQLDALGDHYGGNCFGCERCSFYLPIVNGEPGAVEAYVAFMAEHYQQAIETEPG